MAKVLLKVKYYIIKIIHLLYYTINLFNIKRQNVVIEKGWNINGIVFFSNRGKCTIGKGYCANSGKNKNPIGGDTIARIICLNNAEIKIANNFKMSNSTILAQKEIIIEDNVTIGGSCKIWDTDFHSLNPKQRGTINDIPVNKPIVIKKNAFIGSHTIILKGVTIGENSIIGAGSIVAKSVPDNEIWAGNPACFIKKVNTKYSE